VLRLYAARKLWCSEKTRRPGAATAAAVADIPGQVHLIECEDEALAALVTGDRARARCALGSANATPWSPLSGYRAFRKATRALGYPLG
jgi:hypothetical protein